MTEGSNKKESFFRSAIFKKTLKIILIVTIATSLLLNLFTFIMPVVRFYGESMEPAIKDGQILIVNKLSDIKRGDIIGR